VSLLAVDLIGTHVNEALDAGDLGRLQQHVGAQNVVLGELEGVSEGVVDVGLSREVHNSINLLSLQNEVHQVRTADISLHKLIVREVLNLVQVGKARAVCRGNNSEIKSFRLYSKVIVFLQSSLSKLTILNWGYFFTSRRTT